MRGTKENEEGVGASLEEWQVKTVIEDIEHSGIPLNEVFLLELTELNVDFYGSGRVPKFKTLRTLVSNKLMD